MSQVFQKRPNNTTLEDHLKAKTVHEKKNKKKYKLTIIQAGKQSTKRQDESQNTGQRDQNKREHNGDDIFVAWHKKNLAGKCKQDAVQMGTRH